MTNTYEIKKLSCFGNLGQEPPICAVGHMWRQRNGLMCLKTREAVMRHLMYGADRQTPLAYRSSFPNGYERVDIKILEWIRRVSQQTDSTAAATRRRAS